MIFPTQKPFESNKDKIKSSIFNALNSKNKLIEQIELIKIHLNLAIEKIIDLSDEILKLQLQLKNEKLIEDELIWFGVLIEKLKGIRFNHSSFKKNQKFIMKIQML